MNMRYSKTLAATIFFVVLATSHCDFGVAAEPVSIARSADITKWTEALRQAGASEDEITQFEKMVNALPPPGLVDWENFLSTASPDFFDSYLNSNRRAQGEPRPKPVFPDATPIMSCAALRNLSIPDTTIDSAVQSADTDSCRVTATVIHPPRRPDKGLRGVALACLERPIPGNRWRGLRWCGHPQPRLTPH